MSFYPLDSQRLFALAYEALHGSDSIALARHRAFMQWDRDLADFESVAFDSALEHAGKVLARLTQPADTLARIGQILSVTAQAQRELEIHLAYVSAAADRLAPAQESADYNPFLGAIVQELRALGRGLDQACAKAIDVAVALCTPATQGAQVPLAQRAEESIDEIHAANLDVAPQVVKDRLEDYPHARLLEVGPDTAVIAFGNIDEASKIITMVAGVGSSSPHSLDNDLSRAQRLHQATGATTVMWLGYRAPSTVPVALAAQPAREGGAALREFQHSLKERNPAAYRVVAGHSYGSTVAGYAASGQGLDADALVLMGSPGIPGTPVLNSDEPRLIAALGDRDPIGIVGMHHTAIHGIDPAAAGSGFERWRLAGDHSGYVDDPVFVGKLEELLDK